MALGLTGTTDRVPGLQQQVDQAPIWTFDRDRHLRGITEPGQATGQPGQAIGRVLDSQRGDPPTGSIQHAHRMGGGSPVDPDEQQRFRNVEGQHISYKWRRRHSTTAGAVCRVVSYRRSAAHLPVAGRRPRQEPAVAVSLWPSKGDQPRPSPGPRRVPSETLSQGSVRDPAAIRLLRMSANIDILVGASLSDNADLVGTVSGRRDCVVPG
jgi:hypothetical protein